MVSLGNGFQDPCWCQKLEDKHISFWFVLLHVIVPCKYCRVWLFLRDWRLVTALYQAGLSALFFQQRLLISCLCHISVILTIPQVFSLLLYVMMICDQWSSTFLLYLFWGATNHTHNQKMFWCVLTAPLTCYSLFLPLVGPFYSLRHNNVEIRPTNNPTKTCTCSSERKSHMSLILNQKLEMIKMREEANQKANQKLI